VADTCCGAFVTFNNEQSVALCLADYRCSGGLLSRAFQPRALRFRRRLQTPAQREAADNRRFPRTALWAFLSREAPERCAQVDELLPAGNATAPRELRLLARQVQ
jgi:hypothetical protein